MGNREMVELLVQRSDLAVNVVEGNSCSALMIACMHGYIQARYDIVRYPGPLQVIQVPMLRISDFRKAKYAVRSIQRSETFLHRYRVL